MTRIPNNLNEWIFEIMTIKTKEPLTVLTAYDANIAGILEEIGIDIILVGDSLGNVVLGYNSTKEVTMQDMIRHTEAVRRGAKNSFVVADMPYESDANEKLAIKNAHLLIGAGANAVKIEGKPKICKFLVKNRINVMAHVGLLPQTAKDFKIKGRDDKEAKEIFELALELKKAGCFSIVLELIPVNLARKITNALKIPTIGIGAGPYCDGQVLVINDVLGMYDKPKFVKRYAALNDEIRKAVREYKKDVKKGKFPGEQHSFYKKRKIKN